ncbi:MAG: EAL domain-containing protein [Planctomycetota bacterium]
MTNAHDPTNQLPVDERSFRRVLVVDDQSEIHDTFTRVFTQRDGPSATLADFEARFLDGDTVSAESEPADWPSYWLAHARSGKEALDLVRKSITQDRRFSVAFVDMRMPPGWDGLKTTEELWRADPDLQVVICTAHSDHAWDDVLRRLGCNDRLLLLKKPFETDEVRQLALALSEKTRLLRLQAAKVDELKREVQQRKAVESKLRDMAHRDTLTQLPNRSYLLSRLEWVINLQGRPRCGHDAVLFLDLDNFKIINDSLGHDAGDDLLNEVATRLRECVREHDTTVRSGQETELEYPEVSPHDLAEFDFDDRQEDRRTIRLGGDEFVVMLEQIAQRQDAMAVARRIVQRIAEPFQLGDRRVSVGTSVGVAFIESSMNDALEVLRNADTAMYRAKHAGKGQVAIFDRTMHDAVCRRLELEDELRSTLHNGDFILEYQPIVELDTGKISGVEALIRWRNSAGKLVSPNDFIPIAEEIGLITQLGEWVLDRASRDFVALTQSLGAKLDRHFYFGVNVSRRQLADQSFTQRLNEILDRTGMDRTRLKLEMMESIDPRLVDQSLETMMELQASGIGIQIDDFGKGHSSLTCFQCYPVETVKIDRSFTASITSDHSHGVITQAIVQLAHHLGAQIIAEGVECEAQLDVLRTWGCDAAQGYLFSPPTSLDGLQELLDAPERSEGIRLLSKKISKPIVPMNAGPQAAIHLVD